MKKGFTFLDEAVPGIRWDSKYATWDNFTGQPVEGYETNRIIVSDALAAALFRANAKAASMGCGFLVWDGYRPQRAVDAIVEWAMEADDEYRKKDFYPNLTRMDLLTNGYIIKRSSHSRGCAIDLTLYSLNTEELEPMGTDFDFMDERSGHGVEGFTLVETGNRCLLRYIMEQSGFMADENKWWHYQLKREPYPNRYFNFPIK